MEIYDPETNSWEAGPELLVPLCAMGVVKYYGTVYVVGKALILPSLELDNLLDSGNVSYQTYFACPVQSD